MEIERTIEYLEKHYCGDNTFHDFEAFELAIQALREKQEREARPELPETYDSDYRGLKIKYRVFKARNNEPVENCFVLRPDIDRAAMAALEMYAECCDNQILSRDIQNWMRELMSLQESTKEETHENN